MVLLKVFLAHPGACNRKCFEGRWVDLPIDNNLLKEELKKALEGGNEQAIQDNEYFIEDSVSEYGFKYKKYTDIFSLNQSLKNILDTVKREQITEQDLKALVHVIGDDYMKLEKILREYDYIILRDIENDCDLGHALVKEGFLNVHIPGEFERYVDYEAIGKEFEGIVKISDMKTAVKIFE